ncbi:hypothetical protein ACFUVV_05295 [Streptomyces sp. NPDC057376]|uniref:hypothetical protein n=1 Tax=unclassified Streptomyces TaxID=2593676 RepID=UPI0009393387|nr:hypothetical protein [Streptomyces sp. CB02414]OKI75221.1 hypothetical protein AMK11_34335 [Streptomyces sp. CB02414]
MRDLLAAAERAVLRAEFHVAHPVLRRLQAEYGAPEDYDEAVRYDVLWAALAARAGNWPEAVRRCPDADDLTMAETGVVHALAVTALRRLSDEERSADAHTAALVIVLWAYLLDEDDPGDFRGMLTGRRGAPVPDKDWDKARDHLHGRITDLLHALDVRASRDALGAWQTAWEAERLFPVVAPAEAGSDGLIPLKDAARHLIRGGRRVELLDAYTTRHPDPATWIEDAPDHRACAGPVAEAVAERGRDRVPAGEWSEALSDFSTAARLGRRPGARETAAILHAAKNVGRGRAGHGYSPITRIQGLEIAHALLPQDTSVAAELTAELVRQGQKVLRSDPEQSRKRFARALVVTPRDRDARSGLDDHLKEDLRRSLDGASGGDRPRVGEVQGLLDRDPECDAARRWLREHFAGQAVTEASGGRLTPARAAVRKVLEYDGAGGEGYEDALLDQVLVNLLVLAAGRTGAEGGRAALERRVELLCVADGLAVPAAHGHHVREARDEALLHLAEHLEATATPSDVIELFLQDRMRTGVSARFDQTVETAYLKRARARERAGDPGGARRDRACAARIGAGLPEQGLLFGPGPRPRRASHDDTGQEALF